MFDGTNSNDPKRHLELAQQRLSDMLWYVAASLAAFGLIFATTIATIAVFERAGVHLTLSDKEHFMLD